ncbi:uncharacterized protein VTP21DRAFT_3694 [Calcarisporiella thermophila]|uniref:uncharacterized protein n=1 Tax=Calcarisporiella thermophila TaxID=911321 RepID=UPI003743CE48
MEPRQITIRQATPNDVEAIVELNFLSHREAFRNIVPDEILDLPPLSPERIAFRSQLLRDDNFTHVLAIDSNELVGFCCVGPSVAYPNLTADPTALEVRTLYIRGSHQGIGLGRLLFYEAVELTFKKCPREHLIVLVFEENRNARKFYEKLGGRCKLCIQYFYEGSEYPCCVYEWNGLREWLQKWGLQKKH